MFFLLKKIKKILKKKNKKYNIFYTKNKKYGDITIIIFTNKKKKKEIIKKIKLKLKKYIYKIINLNNNYINIYLNNFFFIKLTKYLYKINLKKILYKKKRKEKKILVEYSSPNTNKPLHIGHLRNILIGDTLSNFLKRIGYKVKTTQIINDRGIHICKTILIWKLLKKKPKKIKIKGDHFVGKLYYKFEEYLNKEKRKNNESKILKLVNKELIKWEKGEKKTLKIWLFLRELVINGINNTYNKLNIKFDDVLYESKIYLLGKKIIKYGLKKKIFYKDKKGLIVFKYKKKKIALLRGNKTSLYITQDLGTFFYRLNKYKKYNKFIYVVGIEQKNYFNILFRIIDILKNKKIEKIHLSYNTVNILGKKIKSRIKYKKKIIFIDDFLKKINKIIKKKFKFNISEISLGAIKYYFLKKNPNKVINFKFKEALNLQGNSGIYIQYTFVRLYSILFKQKIKKIKKEKEYINILKENEIELLSFILDYPIIVNRILYNYDISILIKYIYILSKKINNFYENNIILKNKNKKKKNIRLILCKIFIKILYYNMKILGIPIIKKI
ncbi:MAG: arginine--tRNA ligase [Candidatus Shikimatogenerans bostrichidophilus]|nr:MAG: arginine--tRNA ligase [Candidatus Shikimatogenerans bostrichidophilus]